MDELEERIGRVLNDPEQMERLSSLAQSLLGGGAAAPEPAAAAGLPDQSGALLGKLTGLLAEDAGGERSREGLLQALSPWLSPARRDRLRRALGIARLSRLARTALGEGEGHV
ncbi:MAG: hypothetical protein Q4E38_01470 [Eubacteriales bacterium]|nr:hypothetical protein [Eubacteriales bacterium]